MNLPFILIQIIIGLVNYLDLRALLMIRNIVFDLGNVLIDYNPNRIINAVFTDEETKSLLLEEIFQSKGWKLLDKGVMAFDDHTQNLVSRYPQYATEIDWILKNWHKDQPDVQGMYSLVEKLSRTEFDLYVLSNASERFYNFALANNKIFQFFKGVTISAEIKLLKPQREIYDQFCKIHNLNPEECLFIDDKEENVQAAIDAGWQAYQFSGAFELISYFKTTLGIDLDGVAYPQKEE